MMFLDRRFLFEVAAVLVTFVPPQSHSIAMLMGIYCFVACLQIPTVWVWRGGFNIGLADEALGTSNPSGIWAQCVFQLWVHRIKRALHTLTGSKSIAHIDDLLLGTFTFECGNQ